MKTYRTTIFCKQLTCPSAETLLSYETASPTSELQAEVTSHLAACDFCSAELQLLSKHALPFVEHYERAQMPDPLRYLAESLLAGRLLRMESFVGNIYDKERLTVTQ